jgi:tetratricopeptide (TPR) repeat protein
LTKALEIDPDNEIAHSSMGALQLWYFWNFEESEKSLQMALSLNRSSTLSILNYVALLQATGRNYEALELVDAGIQVDPSNSTMIGNKALCQYLLGRSDEALITVKSITSVKPGTTTDGISGAVALATGYKDAARVLLYLGQYDEVIAILSEYFDTFPERFSSPWPLAEMAIAFLKTGRIKMTEEIIERIKLKAENSGTGSPSYFLSMIYAQMGETDIAFEWLEKAYSNHEVEMYWMKFEPLFDPIREDHRWQELLNRVGFPN